MPPTSTTTPTLDDAPPQGEDQHRKGLKASLIGWHGRENAGDDVFCVILAKWLVEALGAQKIEVTAVDKRLPHLELPEGYELCGVLSDSPAGRIQRILREPKYLFGKDVVIYGAGSIFSVRRFAWLTMQLWTLRFLRWLRISRTPIAGIGISIGPFRKSADRYWCKKVLRLFDVVMVRDEKSYEIGKEFGIKNLIASYDLALALPKLFSVSEHNAQNVSQEHPVIGFSIVDRDAELGRPEIDRQKNDNLFQSLKSFAETHPETLFRGFVFCNDTHRGDLETTEGMLRRLQELGSQVELVKYENDPLKLIAELSSCDAMICNRMHSFVFACLSQTPAIMLSYAPKMTEFARSLGVPDWLQFSHTEIDPECFRDALLRVYKEGTIPCDKQLLDTCSQEVAAHLELAAEQLQARM